MSPSAMWDCHAIRHKIEPHEKPASPHNPSKEVLEVNTFGSFHPTFPNPVTAYLDDWDRNEKKTLGIRG